MKIGIDISALQTGHRLRGIGATLINFINHLPESAKEKHEFVFYIEPGSIDNPLELLELSGVNYEVSTLKEKKEFSVKLPGIAGKLANSGLRVAERYKKIYFGNNRLPNINELDYFLQFDQGMTLPPKRKVKSLLVAYDIIPYVLEADYLWKYSTARLNGCSVQGALRHALAHHTYKVSLRASARKANQLIAISNYTKDDLVKHIGIKPGKISVCLLGINHQKAASKDTPKLQRYIHTGWIEVPKPISLEGQRFLLFVGGVDPRRKLVDLVAAFNNLKARGENVKLVLAGDTSYSAENVLNAELQKYFTNTSYLDDVIFMGFVNDAQRDWLYNHALAFVFPSVYEGFGLPILEAMDYGTPVIAYKNSSISEVAGNAVLYAKDYQDIIHQVLRLDKDSHLRAELSKKGKEQSAKFDWSKTAETIMQKIGS